VILLGEQSKGGIAGADMTRTPASGSIAPAEVNDTNAVFRVTGKCASTGARSASLASLNTMPTPRGTCGMSNAVRSGWSLAMNAATAASG
jgi:hypothetical protein